MTLLAEHTTLRLGGPAHRYVVATTDDELVGTVRAADAAGEPVLLVAGGSNLVVGDEGFPGVVVQVATTGITPDIDDCEGVCGGVLVTVAAGESWEALVERAVRSRWTGIEALSGIPGSVGATPYQNVGAYGQEVAQTIASVRTWDRHEGAYRTFANADCRFGYRASVFKAHPDRYVILQVVFQFRIGDLGAPLAYAELAHSLGRETGARVPMRDVRRAVLALRRRKGMVLDAHDHDTWSAGSFFTNPVLDAEVAAALPAEAPRWPMPDGRVKTSAAWLIQRAGFDRGHGTGRVALSAKHTLALTNRGGATTADLLDLAREVRDGVEAAYGVRLTPEPQLVGCDL